MHRGLKDVMLDVGQRRAPRRYVRRQAAVGKLILACLSWGFSTALTKIVLDQLTPVDLFGIEILVSAIPLAFLAVARGARPSRPDPMLLVLGVLEPGLTYVLFDLGVRRTTASHAALLLALDSPATLALAVMFLRERINLPLLTSLVMGIAGSVLVTWHSDGAGSSLIGDALVIGSSLTAASYGVLARHVAPGRDPVVVTAVQMLGALMIAVPIFVTSAARGDSHIASADVAHLALATTVGLLGGIIPFLLFNDAITELTASRAGLIGVLVPVIGAAASILLLDEKITALALTGGCFALVAALIAARRDDNPRPSTQDVVAAAAPSRSLTSC
jgi:drug/metabolite transporter (DMT)-like permease